MERYSDLSKEYFVKEGFYNKGNRKLTLEVIMNTTHPMTVDEQVRLAFDMQALYKTRNWEIDVKYFLYSIKHSSYIVLIKANDILIGNYFTSKRHVQSAYYTGDFYYTERICLHKSISPEILLLCLAVSACNLPEFLNKPILTASIAQKEIIEKFLNLFGTQILNSDRDWHKLSFEKQELVKEMTSACLCDDTDNIFAAHLDNGIIRDIYKDVFEPGFTPDFISYNESFTQCDGRLLVNEIPACMNEIMENFMNNKKLSKSGLFMHFMEQFRDGSFYNDLELIRREV